MIGFIIKGVLRDRNRSLFPILIVAAGTMLTVFFYSYMQGGKNNFIETSARYQTGHLKVMTRAYAAEADLLPNDLALTEVSKVLSRLQSDYPDIVWKPRLRFSGLIDLPDENGETRAQGPISGLAVQLFSPPDKLSEIEILNLRHGLIAGHLPQKPQEILVGSELARLLQIKPGDRATLISSTMTGALAIADFTVAGIIRFGITPLDKGLVIADLADIQSFLDMEDAAGEIFGFFPDFLYRPRVAGEIAQKFNRDAGATPSSFPAEAAEEAYENKIIEAVTSIRIEQIEHIIKIENDGKFEKGGEVDKSAEIDRGDKGEKDEKIADPEFQPVMLTLGQQGGLADMISIYDTYAYVLVAVFVAVMSIVLWNAGLMGSLRRYGEIGLRLAMGETRAHLYTSLLTESLLIGVLGSVLGTALGLAIAYYLQTYGINAEAFTKSSEMMMINVIRAQVTWVSYVIGFIPGLAATLLGTAIAGIGVFRRRTATLMKEFEA